MCLCPAEGAGEADARHHRVLLQAAGGRERSSAAHCTLHWGHVCQRADGGGQAVSVSGETLYPAEPKHTDHSFSLKMNTLWHDKRLHPSR